MTNFSRGFVFFKLLCVIIGCLSLAVPAPAEVIVQKEEIKDISPGWLDIDELSQIRIVTASKRPESIVEIPAAVHVVTSEDIKRSGATTIPEALRNVPGLNEPLTLPDDFVIKLSSTLERKSVVSWLLSFGTQGRKLAPQVAGCLLGLQFGGKSKTLPISEQNWSKDIVIAGLTKLYGEQKARTMFNKEAPFLSPNMTNEDALKAILQTIGKEG